MWPQVFVQLTVIYSCFFDNFFPVLVLSGLVRSLPIHIQSAIPQNIQGDFYAEFWSSIHAQLPSLCYLAKQILASSVAVISWSLRLPSSARPPWTVWLPSPLSSYAVLSKVIPCKRPGEWCGLACVLPFMQESNFWRFPSRPPEVLLLFLSASFHMAPNSIS